MKASIMNKTLLATMVAVSALASGCSTLTGDGTSQNLSVMTYSSDNKDLVGAQCELKNDEGTWTAVTPTTVMVRRSNKDLMVKCTKSGFSDARANVVSKTKGNMFGNIIFGGGVAFDNIDLRDPQMRFEAGVSALNSNLKNIGRSVIFGGKQQKQQKHKKDKY